MTSRSEAAPRSLRAGLSRAAARLAGGLLVLSLLRGLWLLATTDARAIAFPYPVDYGEGQLLYQVMRLSRFEGIYPPLSGQLPHTIANYPPVYPLLQVPLAWLFGPALWYGRALSLLGALATAALTRTSEQIPFRGGELVLGTWQGIYVWEHRTGRHRREIAVHLMGE